MAGACGGPASDPTKPTPTASNTGGEDPTVSPEKRLYEQLRSGMFQMGAAAGSIEEALSAARDAAAQLKGDLKGAMEDAIESIDAAGAGVAEYAADPPEEAEVAKDFATWDERRLKAVEAANDAMHDLREAAGLLADADETNPGPAGQPARDVRALVLVALDDLWGAIEAFGGTPETEE